MKSVSQTTAIGGGYVCTVTTTKQSYSGGQARPAQLTGRRECIVFANTLMVNQQRLYAQYAKPDSNIETKVAWKYQIGDEWDCQTYSWHCDTTDKASDVLTGDSKDIEFYGPLQVATALVGLWTPLARVPEDFVDFTVQYETLLDGQVLEDQEVQVRIELTKDNGLDGRVNIVDKLSEKTIQLMLAFGDVVDVPTLGSRAS